ncbi:protein PML [Platysternon megacephalum]|uniref:Protein PML n=1 Tax=Platysternon megacephalum TaxID=55544 RepID=A0A4D9ECC7_9SAUR|nr:protein PML [Platysternon megacephalum]
MWLRNGIGPASWADGKGDQSTRIRGNRQHQRGDAALSARIRMDCAGDSISQLPAILESDSESSEDEEVATHEALLQERDEAKEKLSEFEQASQRLLAELSALEVEYEIEISCRKQAEVYAAQVNRENKKLKRISVALLPMLNQLPEDVLSLATEEDSPSDPSRDPAYPYLQQIKDLQEKVSRLLGEKKELTIQVQELQSQIRELRDQVEEERAERRSLQAAMDRSHKAQKKYKRVSQMVTQEYNEAMQQLELEQDLRQHAETFAHKMLVKQKEANRQSMILLQNVGPNAQLLQALDEVASLTGTLEEAKREHQEKVKGLQEQLEGSQEELGAMRVALAAAEAEKLQLGEQLHQAEERNVELEGKVTFLEEKLERAEAPPSEPDSPEVAPPPPPPPPPPLPLPASSAPVDPLLVIKQRKGMRQQKPSEPATDDVKAQAVEEMMARIKSGVALRPAKKDRAALSQDRSTAASKRKSTVMELQGILGTMKRPVRKQSWRKHSQKSNDNQLQSILQRRRRVLDASTPAQPSPLRAELRKEVQNQGASEICEAVSSPCSEENVTVVQLRARSVHLQKSRQLALLNEAEDTPA